MYKIDQIIVLLQETIFLMSIGFTYNIYFIIQETI